jgi:integrase
MNDGYTLTALKKMCGKYSIVPLEGKSVSFEACAGTILDKESGKYKKVRQTFGSRKYGSVDGALIAAKAWLREMAEISRADKTAIVAIPPHVRAQTIWALEECDRLDVSYIDVVNAGLAALREKVVLSELTLAEAADKLIAAKERDCSETYQKDLRFFFNDIGRDFGHWKLDEITADDLEDWLEDRDYSPVTWNNKLRLLSVLWNFALEPRQKWVKENVALHIERKTVEDEEVEAFTIQQASAVLKSTATALPRLLPYVVIGMFCGLRRSELQRADWSDIDWETRSLRVRVTKSRSASSRYVHLQDVAIEWLEPIAKAGGPICTSPRLRREDLKELRKMTFAWGGNIFRHSFGTYHYHAFSDPQRTIVEMGHTTTQMLFKHYRRPVPQTTALEYWKLTREAVLA